MVLTSKATVEKLCDFASSRAFWISLVAKPFPAWSLSTLTMVMNACFEALLLQYIATSPTNLESIQYSNIFALLISLAMIFTLVACSSSVEQNLSKQEENFAVEEQALQLLHRSIHVYCQGEW